MAVQTLPLLLVTPGTLQTLACLVGGTPLLATPGVVLELICEWFRGCRLSPCCCTRPPPPYLPYTTMQSKLSALLAECPLPLSILKKGSGGTVAAPETFFNRGVLVHIFSRM